MIGNSRGTFEFQFDDAANNIKISLLAGKEIVEALL